MQCFEPHCCAKAMCYYALFVRSPHDEGLFTYPCSSCRRRRVVFRRSPQYSPTSTHQLETFRRRNPSTNIKKLVDYDINKSLLYRIFFVSRSQVKFSRLRSKVRLRTLLSWPTVDMSSTVLAVSNCVGHDGTPYAVLKHVEAEF